MKILICGSRTIVDQSWVFSQIDDFVKSTGISYENLIVIHGGAKGVDTIADSWANIHGVKTDVHKPDYARYGRGAPYRRNADMVMATDKALILWNGLPGGTKNDIDLCKKNRKDFKLIYYKN